MLQKCKTSLHFGNANSCVVLREQKRTGSFSLNFVLVQPRMSLPKFQRNFGGWGGPNYFPKARSSFAPAGEAGLLALQKGVVSAEPHTPRSLRELRRARLWLRRTLIGFEQKDSLLTQELAKSRI